MGPTAVVVTYNSEAVVSDCLEALVGSGVPRVLVVDNASTDRTRSIVEARAARRVGIELMAQPTNLGFGRAVNRAAEETDGDLLLVNPDLLLNASAARALEDALDASPRVGCASCRLELSDGSLDPACLRRIPGPMSAAAYFLRRVPFAARLSRYHPPREDYFRSLGDVEAVNGALMLVRREAFDSIGGFDERFFMYGEDLDLCLSLREHGWEIRYRGDVAATHLKGSSSGPPGERSGRAAVAFEEAMRLFFDKHQAPRVPRPVVACLRGAMGIRARYILGPAGYREYRAATASARATPSTAVTRRRCSDG